MNYTKQTDWFDIHIDNAAKVITVKQRWGYKWAHHLGEKVWTLAEEKLFGPYPMLLINLFWRAIPKLRVKGNSTFARENSQGSFQLRFELEHAPTHPLLGTPHWSIHIYKHRNRLCTSSSVFWHSRQVILNLHEVLGEEAGLLKGYSSMTSSSPSTTLSNSAINGLKNTESHSGTLSSHFDREHITNSGLTLRDLNVKYVLRELNKLLPHTTFYSDFSTDFDYHSTLNQGSGASTVQAKDTTKRVTAPFRFAAERDVRPPEPESKLKDDYRKEKGGKPSIALEEEDGKAYEKERSNSRLATPEEAAALMDLKADLSKENPKLRESANIATAKGTIDGKPIDLTANSSKFNAKGTVQYKSFTEQNLKTQPTASDVAKGRTHEANRAYDSEAKMCEHILDNTTPESTGEVTIMSENDFCTSCENILDVQMKELRPGIKINKVYVKPYKNK